MIGQTLGHYRIEEELGSGGMGVVYRATDGKLGRQVAIKVLPEAFAHHPERLSRFEREARILASLNHPNVAAIHGLEECNCPRYLVLELVPGQTVAERIAQGPLALKEALAIHRQIAEALEAAHEKGIVHRDLKPANVKITPEGKAKVLDFGLAKALEPPSAVDTNFSQSPTLTVGPTNIGTVLGTVAYMSPEQARGQFVDKRTDIWAFGCVLFETLAGRRAFPGETTSDCMAAVLATEPDWKALPASTPAGICALLQRCLQKDPQRRLRDIGDAGIELDEALALRDSRSMPAIHSRSVPKRRILATTAGVLLSGGLAAALAMYPWRPGTTVHRVTRFAVPLAPDEVIYPTRAPQLAISPDGSRLAYQTGGQVFIRALDQQDAKPVDGAIGAAPFFSPDGQWLGFYHTQTQTIRKVALSGGAPVTVGEVLGIAGASWGEDGNIVTALFDLYIIPATGGAAKTLLQPDVKNGERTYRAPEYLPGGKAILFTIGREDTDTFDDAQIAVLSLETGKKKILIEGGMNARYSPTGHLVYARNGGLLAAPFDVKTLTVTGRPFPVVDAVFTSVNGGMAAFSLSANGDLVYAPGGVEGGERVPSWVDRHGAATPFAIPRRSYLHPQLSSDDGRLVMEVEGPRHDIFSYELSRGVLTKLSLDGNSHLPVWTPGGDRVTFRSERAGPMTIWWSPADRSGAEEMVTPEARGVSPGSWSPDGRALVFNQLNAETGSDIFFLTLDGDRKPHSLVQTKYQEGSAKFSPDGKWVAYSSNESGRPQVYVTPFPGPGPTVQVSADGGTDPVWRRKGGEMFYRNGDKMMVVLVNTQPKLTLSMPQVLWEGHYLHGVNSSCGPAGATSANYDVTADGQRFVMIDDKTQDFVARQINVVLGWAEELKRAAQAASR